MGYPKNTDFVDYPSQREVKEEYLDRLAAAGCDVCGEDDPLQLTEVKVPMPSCQAFQAPPPEQGGMRVLCDEHEDSTDSYRERMLERARTLNERYPSERASTIVALVFYECDNVEFAKRTVDHRRETPEAPVRCKCGAELDDVVYLTEDD